MRLERAVSKEGTNHMVRIRLTRAGAKKRPFYRVIAIDQRDRRDGRPLQFLGTYDPKLDPPAIQLNLEAIDAWVGKGAQMAETVKSFGRDCARSRGIGLSDV